MQLNEVSLVDRHNRPTVLQKVALRAFFINDGEFYDPYDISGVTIFNRSSNLTPSSVLSNNLIASSVTSDLIKMHFAPSGTNVNPPGMDVTSYNPGTDIASTSGVYRVKAGEYICVLDGTQDTSGFYDFYGSSVVVANTASAVGDYIDCWTIKFSQNSDYTTFVNDVHLYDDTFFVVTQPVILSTSNRLVNKHITLSSIENLKVTTEITIQNKDIDASVKNIFKNSAITSAMMKIEKINEDSVALPAHVEVSGYSDTSSLVDITSDNTIILNFNTQNLATHPNVASFGGLTGAYRVTVKYTLLNETIITQPYYFTIS